MRCGERCSFEETGATRFNAMWSVFNLEMFESEQRAITVSFDGLSFSGFHRLMNTFLISLTDKSDGYENELH